MYALCSGLHRDVSLDSLHSSGCSQSLKRKRRFSLREFFTHLESAALHIQIIDVFDNQRHELDGQLLDIHLLLFLQRARLGFLESLWFNHQALRRRLLQKAREGIRALSGWLGYLLDGSQEQEFLCESQHDINSADMHVNIYRGVTDVPWIL